MKLWSLPMKLECIGCWASTISCDVLPKGVTNVQLMPESDVCLAAAAAAAAADDMK
jgi:hypothetical protein